LYPSETDYDSVKQYKSGPYITVSPASVWFTKQFPKEKWVDFMNVLPEKYNVYLLGAKGDIELCNFVKNNANHKSTEVLAGKLSFLQTSALMKDADMNYTNDSAPLHFASAMNAPVTALFCSTIPEFGFGPLSDDSHIVQVREKLECRPCGLHGFKECPLGHFRCAFDIRVQDLIRELKD
jgi:ADP-heptose:LPS heptosyltransferase